MDGRARAGKSATIVDEDAREATGGVDTALGGRARRGRTVADAVSRMQNSQGAGAKEGAGSSPAGQRVDGGGALIARSKSIRRATGIVQEHAVAGPDAQGQARLGRGQGRDGGGDARARRRRERVQVDLVQTSADRDVDLVPRRVDAHALHHTGARVGADVAAPRGRQQARPAARGDGPAQAIPGATGGGARADGPQAQAAVVERGHDARVGAGTDESDAARVDGRAAVRCPRGLQPAHGQRGAARHVLGVPVDARGARGRVPPAGPAPAL